MHQVRQLVIGLWPGSTVLLLIRLLWGGVLGATVGSYLGCVAYRLPRRLPLAPDSACPGCGSKIPLRRMIPVVSFVAQRGKAACCGVPLACSYLAFEVGTLLALAAVSTAFGVGPLLVAAIVVLVVPAQIGAAHSRREPGG